MADEQTPQFSAEPEAVAPSVAPVQEPPSAVEAPVASPQEEDIKGKTVSSKGRKVLSVVLIILLLLLCGIGLLVLKLFMPNGTNKSAGNGVTWIRSIYGFGPQNVQLTNPSGCAIDPRDGTFWMADTNFRRIVHYRMDGTMITFIGKSKFQATSPIRHPSDIAIDPEGNIYVVESTYNDVLVFNAAGKQLGKFDIPQPTAIAVNDKYIVVGAKAGFVIMDKNAKILKLVGTLGRGEGQFDTVNGIALDKENNIYVVDTYNNRISKYTPEGKLVWLTKTGYPGNEHTTLGKKKYTSKDAAQMQVPMGCTLDAAGHLLVIDMFDFTIAQFDAKTGKYIAKFGTYGTEDGKFLYSSDIDYDASTDTFVVSDTGNQRAQIIRLPNSGGSLFAKVRSLLSGPLALCCIPILIIIICLIIAYIMQRNRKKKEQEKYYKIALEKESVIE